MANWFSMGQTSLAANTSVDDAAVNALLELPGQVDSWPYTVPEGKALTIEAYGIEGYDRDMQGVCVCFPWIERADDTPPAPMTSAYRIPRSLASCSSGGNSNELVGLRVEVPAGYKVHWRMINGTDYTAVYGWYVRGELSDVLANAPTEGKINDAS